MFSFLNGLIWGKKKTPEEILEEDRYKPKPDEETLQEPLFIQTTRGSKPISLLPPEKKSKQLQDRIDNTERYLKRLKELQKGQLEKEGKESEKLQTQIEEEERKRKEAQRQKEEEKEYERRKQALLRQRRYPALRPSYQRGETGTFITSPQTQEITITPQYLMKLQGQSLPSDLIIYLQQNGQDEYYGGDPRIININVYPDRFSFVFMHNLDLRIFRSKWDIVKLMIPISEEFNDYSVFDFDFYASLPFYRISFKQLNHGITTDGDINWDEGLIGTGWPPTDYLNNKYIIIEFKNTYTIPAGFETGLILQKQPNPPTFQSIPTQPTIPLLTNSTSPHIIPPQTQPKTGPIIEEVKEEKKEEKKEDVPIFQGFSFKSKKD